MANLTEVKVGTIDVTDYLIKYEIKTDFGNNITEATIELSPQTVISLTNGLAVTIKRGELTATEDFIFDGVVDLITNTSIGAKLVCKDKLTDLMKNEVTKSYDSNIDSSAGKISEIFKDLVNTYGGGTLTASAVSVQDSGTEFVIGKFICNHEDVYKKCQELANLLDWQFYYKASTGLVYFEPKGFLGQNGELIVGGDLSENLEWKYDSSELANEITVFGATQDVETEVSGQLNVTSGFTAGDAGTGYMGFKPVSVKVYADAAATPTTLRTGGVPGSTPTYDYSVDQENKKLIWETSGGYAWTANHYVKALVTHTIPVPIVGSDAASIAKYYLVKKTFFFTDLKSVIDAEKKLNSLLVKYSVPFISTVASPRTRIDLVPGQTVRVVDDTAGEDRILLVNSVTQNWPDDDELSLGDKTWKLADWQTEVMDRITALESSTALVSDFLVHLYPSEYNVPLRERYLSVEKLGTGTWFVLDHNTKGLVDEAGGTGILDGADGASEVIYMVPGGNTFKEFVYDTEFYDAVNSVSVTWDHTVDHDISLSGGSAVLYTNFFAKGTVYTYATVTCNATTGTPIIEISADNKVHWQTLVDSARTALTYSDDNGVYLRITGTGGGGGYTLTGASYDSKSKDISTELSQPTGVFFKSDGLVMFVIGLGNSVYKYTLSVAWDVSTASYASVSFATSLSNCEDIFFKSDGTSFYVVNRGAVHQFNMSSAWDITTATNVGNISVSSQDGSMVGLWFNSTGTKMFTCGYSTNSAFSYTLATPWSITTATYDSKSYVMTSETPMALSFSADGLTLLELGYIGGSTDTVRQHTLTIAWDLATASSAGITYATHSTTSTAMFVNWSNGKLYEAGQGNKIVYQSSLGSGISLVLANAYNADNTYSEPAIKVTLEDS